MGDVVKPTEDHQGLLHSAYLAYLWAIKRADERTRTADLLITSDTSGVAGVCTGLQIPLSRPVPVLCLAQRCTVLRSRWCQSGVRSSWIMLRRFLCARCASKDKDRLPATEQIQPRLLPPPLLHWKYPSS